MLWFCDRQAGTIQSPKDTDLPDIVNEGVLSGTVAAYVPGMPFITLSKIYLQAIITPKPPKLQTKSVQKDLPDGLSYVNLRKIVILTTIIYFSWSKNS